MDIDLVYLWVNGNDPKWQAKRDACIGRPSGSQAHCKGRYADSGELKYSLRSAEKYAPWIRRIFIVTDNQIPEWLNTDNPKVQIVDHTEIMPAECLPCFNSAVIEMFLCNIPGLSEHFLYANDDTYFGKPVQTSSTKTIFQRYSSSANRSENWRYSTEKRCLERSCPPTLTLLRMQQNW